LAARREDGPDTNGSREADAKKFEIVPKKASNEPMAAEYEFGPFRLDTEAGILYRGSDPVGVGQRAVALLGALVERGGAPVSKEALIEAAWPGLAVEENNLTVQIAALRRVFAQEPGGERWIETLPRRGYRFVGPVEATDDEGELPKVEPAEAAPALPLPDKPSIAVLPFDNLSGDPEQEYFADGLAEDIITSLSKFHWFFVIARNSSFTYKGRAVDVKQVARELGVQYVLEGSVRRAGARVRITAQLIDALTGRHVWAERYDRDLSDIFVLQDEVTEAIVGKVAPSFISAESRRVERKPPDSFDAWDYVMRGKWHLARRNKNGLAEARRLFEKALSIDPRSTTALSGLAVAIGISINFGWPDDLDKAREAGFAAARRALELDDKDAEGHFALARISMVAKQLDAAVGACRRALEINPNLAVAEGLLGIMLGWRGDYSEAKLHADRAARLSPNDLVYSWSSLAHSSVAFGTGQYERAVESARTTIEALPDFPGGWRYLVASLAHLGRMEEASAAKDQLLRILPHESVGLIRATLPWDNADFMERFVDGLRKAGVPE
jgi:TolB-like protein/Flp pilus assembly protein TadD